LARRSVVVLGSALRWRKSSYSGTGNCVEVAHADQYVLVRHSKMPDGPILRFTNDEWRAFALGMTDGEFDD
jgi:hypothetical protein